MKKTEKILILGPGRSGTTFLMQLLSEMGEDCGLNKEGIFVDWDYVKEKRAGLEFSVDLLQSSTRLRKIFSNAPQVIKGPIYANYIKELYRKGVVDVKHVIIPYRDLGTVTQSRLDVDLPVTGQSDNSELEENMAAVLFGKSIEFCLVDNIPMTLMEFPKLVDDSDYCYNKLSEVFDWNREIFDRTFEKTAHPEMVKFRKEGDRK